MVVFFFFFFYFHIRVRDIPMETMGLVWLPWAEPLSPRARPKWCGSDEKESIGGVQKWVVFLSLRKQKYLDS